MSKKQPRSKNKSNRPSPRLLRAIKAEQEAKKEADQARAKVEMAQEIEREEAKMEQEKMEKELAEMARRQKELKDRGLWVYQGCRKLNPTRGAMRRQMHMQIMSPETKATMDAMVIRTFKTAERRAVAIDALTPFHMAGWDEHGNIDVKRLELAMKDVPLYDDPEGTAEQLERQGLLRGYRWRSLQVRVEKEEGFAWQQWDRRVLSETSRF